MDFATLHTLLRREDAPTPDMALPVLTKDPGPTVNGAIWSIGAVSTAFLMLRVYCKQIRAKGMWWDDWLLIVAWVRITLMTS